MKKHIIYVMVVVSVINIINNDVRTDHGNLNLAAIKKAFAVDPPETGEKVKVVDPRTGKEVEGDWYSRSVMGSKAVASSIECSCGASIGSNGACVSCGVKVTYKVISCCESTSKKSACNFDAEDPDC